VVSTVPTLAALWPTDQLVGIRLLILGGEACPAELAQRLVATCPEVWNTYGPTETTVVACAARMSAGEPVRIGLPLDGWQLAVVDPDSRRPVQWGQLGELVIGGVGTARYLDPDKDAAKFQPLPALGWDRAYCSGDLVRADPAGLCFVGRADTQVKVRGYRIELSEIESVLGQVPGIARAVVTTYEPRPGLVELVGYYRPGTDAVTVDQQRVYEQLRSRLPAHMVPAYLQELAVIPTLTSGKADRKKLPAPSGARRLAGRQPYVAPATAIETILAEALADILGLDQVSVDSHFFDDLGVSSLLAAHFCARARKRPELPPLAIRDVYVHPTIRDLAAVLHEAAPADRPPRADLPQPAEPVARVGTAQYLLCGALQLLMLLGMVFIGSVVLATGMRWLWPATDAGTVYLRCVVWLGATFLVFSAVPIAAKWALIGRWRPQEIRIWSLAYVRFWAVKTLIRFSPLAMFRGSPLYVLYLRALGAKIGRGVVLFSRTVPVCTDLLTIGDGTIIRKDAALSGYQAHAGMIRTGPTPLGRNVVIGEGAVIDIWTSMGDDAQLGHSSSLHCGQAVPNGESWHGSPAQPSDVDYRAVAPARCGTLRRALFGGVQLVNLLLLAPLVLTAVLLVATQIPQLVELIGSGPPLVTRGAFYLEQLAISFVLFFGAVLLGLSLVITLPKVLHRALEPDRVYPLYGFHYWICRTIARTTNTPFYMTLFGDSSYIVNYLRALGYKLSRSGQTGSNFGAAQKHETPYRVSVGTGTIISDDISFLTADFSSTSFRTRQVSLGARCFFGNSIRYPSDGRVGDNCLIGTKTMVPLDGEVRQNVGLLGSPCFEIPRSGQPDSRFELSSAEFRRRLAAKNQHNIATMGIFLLVQWIRVYITLLIGLAAVDLGGFGTLGIFAALVAESVFNVGYTVLVARAASGFRALRPQYCSIYEPYFWWHERYWKLSSHPGILNGTPLKILTWRLVGLRIGKRVFDDGCDATEPTLVSIGDDCTLNLRTVLQSHSMEDGIFKSDRITIGAGCTLGSGAFVHYGVTTGAGSSLGTDSFVMKGEEVPAHARWAGNPARELPDLTPTPG
jgi:non-ribosomal peptide synthetase-like protein